MIVTSVERKFELFKSRHPFPATDGWIFDTVEDVYNFAYLRKFSMYLEK